MTKALRAKAQEYLTQLDAQLGHVALDAPAGAVVRVDGNSVTAGASIDVEPGAHAIEARLGEQVGTVDVVAVAGATVPARVVFDGPKVVGPVVPAPVVVVVPPVEPPVTTPRSQDESHTTRDVLRWTTAGVAVAGVAVGVAFLVEAHSQASDFNTFQIGHPGGCASPSSAVCAAAHSKDSNVSQSTTVAGVGFAAGGVAAVTSAALWLFWPADAAKPSATTWVRPNVGLGSCTLDVGGRF